MPQFEKYTIGDCTLYRGDASFLRNEGCLNGSGAIVSDPPYGIAFKYGGGGSNGNLQSPMTRIDNGTKGIVGDDVAFDPRPWVAFAPYENHLTLKEPRILLWGADAYKHLLPLGGTLLAWDKHLGRGSDDSFADCEWAWCGRKVKREVFRWLWKGIVCEKSALDYPPDGIKGGKGVGATRFARLHVSQKPVELMRWCIERVRPLKDKPILDPYMGSGSTALAALSLGYSFVGCDVDPHSFAIAKARVEAFYSAPAAN